MATKNPTHGNQNIVNNQLEKQLKETEIGSWIAEHKALAISLVVVIIVGVIGWGVFQMQSESSNNEKAGAVYQFTEGALKQFTEKKLDAAGLVDANKKLHKDLGNFKGLFHSDILVADQLSSAGHLKEAAGVLEQLLKKTSDNFQTYMVRVRLAVVYEDLGEYQKAITVLESLNASQTKLMESKNYLDLGRLYMVIGAKDKAKVNFEYVLNNMAQDEFAKLAKLYLGEME